MEFTRDQVRDRATVLHDRNGLSGFQAAVEPMRVRVDVFERNRLHGK